MARPGRPRANPEQKILAEMSEDEKRVEAILAEKLKSSAQSGFRMAFEAACVLHTLERGTQYQRALCERAIRGLRRTQWARANDPYGKLPDPEFLERFIEGHAPGWNWRESARIGEIENENYERENERLAKMHADDARFGMALTSKWYTPDVPDACTLLGLPWEWRSKRPTRDQVWRQRRFIRAMWPTLREVKLATAIPEKALRKIIRDLGPKKTEMTKALRHGSKRGAVPVSYGPRLIVGVLSEFLNRLPEFPIDNEERERLRKIAKQIKRAFVARISRSPPST